MCDTFVQVTPDRVFFAKNSDRDANEEQILDWVPAQKHTQKKVKLTWVEVDQVPETYAVLLSRPKWMWGAEIGSNEFGVTIGNEAVFTKKTVPKLGVTGMDLLRLALERSRTAKQAVEVITGLLETYPQGGVCSKINTSFRYFSSYLIADAHEAYVLETCADSWEVEKVSAGRRSISNGLTIPSFAKQNSDFVKTLVSRSKKRKQLADCAHIQSFEFPAFCEVLRGHANNAVFPEFSWVNGAMDSLCMHAGGLLAASQTTASWVSAISSKKNEIWVTGTSAPCLSLFKPVDAMTPTPFDRDGTSFWWEHEVLHRKLMLCDEKTVTEFQKERDELQKKFYKNGVSTIDMIVLEKQFKKNWLSRLNDTRLVDNRPFYLKRFWAKNQLLQT